MGKDLQTESKKYIIETIINPVFIIIIQKK